MSLRAILLAAAPLALCAPLLAASQAAQKIAREDLIRQMDARGFRLAAEHTFLPYQYFLVFEAAAEE